VERQAGTSVRPHQQRAEQRGRGEDTAEQIAARTVNKERARSGEAEQRSRTSTQDMSSGRRGGQRSRSGSKGRTKEQLYADARRKGIKGRSKMSKAELSSAVDRQSGEPQATAAQATPRPPRAPWAGTRAGQS
jgi:hypothetical protein